MSNLKERLINGFFMALVALVVIGSGYLMYRTELLNDCVEAKSISGKLYSETKECKYLFN